MKGCIYCILHHLNLINNNNDNDSSGSGSSNNKIHFVNIDSRVNVSVLDKSD